MIKIIRWILTVALLIEIGLHSHWSITLAFVLIFIAFEVFPTAQPSTAWTPWEEIKRVKLGKYRSIFEEAVFWSKVNNKNKEEPKEIKLREHTEFANNHFENMAPSPYEHPETTESRAKNSSINKPPQIGPIL